MDVLSIEEVFTPGNAVQLIFSKYQGHIQSFKAIVKSFGKDGLFITTNEQDEQDLMDTGAEIVIQYESPEGTRYLFSTYQISKIFKDSATIICARPWKMNSLQQYRFFGPQVEMPWKVHSTSLRRYFRIKMDLPFYYLVDEVIHVGRIIDLSLGGLFAVVLPDARLLLASQLTFQLQLPKQPSFEMQGEIMRSQTIENTKLGIAVNFLDLSEEKREAIARCLQEF